MPDLTGLTWNFGGLGLARFLAGAGPKEPHSWALVSNFVRLVDQLVRQYELARKELGAHVETPNNVVGHLFNAIFSMEVILGLMDRCLRLLKRIRQDRSGPPLNEHRSALRQLERAESRVSDLRNSVEHLENDILGGVYSGKYFTLRCCEKGVELGDVAIEYQEIALWTKQLHGVAQSLISYREPD